MSVHARESVRLLISGVQRNATVATVLGSEMVGAVAEGPVAIASMPVAQQLAGRPSRVSEVLIEARRGREREVATELRRLSGGELEVTGADHEVALLANAGSVSVPASASCSRTASSMRCHAS